MVGEKAECVRQPHPYVKGSGEDCHFRLFLAESGEPLKITARIRVWVAVFHRHGHPTHYFTPQGQALVCVYGVLWQLKRASVACSEVSRLAKIPSWFSRPGPPRKTTGLTQLW
jgi:hypothetical protein